MAVVARTDGTAPRIGRRAGGVVPIMYLAVSGPVIVILGLVILLRAVGVGSGPVVFKLRKKRQQIRGAGDIAGGVTSAAGVVAVLGGRLHNRPEIRRQGCQQGVGRGAGGAGAVAAQHGLSHVAVIPPAAVRVRRVHGKGAGGAGVVAVIAVYQAHQGAVDLADLEMDPVAALTAGVVVETQDKHGNGQIGDRRGAHLSVDRDPLGVAHAPVIGPLSGVGHGADRCPAVGGQRVGNAGDRHRGGGRLGHAALGIADSDRRGVGCHGGGAAGVAGDGLFTAVRHGSGDHHSRAVERFAGEIGGFRGCVGHRDTGKVVAHGNGLGAGLTHAALCVGNRDRGIGQSQGAGG